MKRLTVFLIIFFCLKSISVCNVRSAKCDSIVQQAWRSWTQNDHSEIRRLLNQALSADPKSTRAHLALAFLCEIERNEVNAWKEIRAIENDDPKYFPALFALWNMIPSSVTARKSTLEFAGQLISHPDPTGTLRAMACEKAGEIYELRNEISKSRAAYREMQSVDDWMLIGPFENISASGFDRNFLPEQAYDAGLTMDGKNGVPL